MFDPTAVQAAAEAPRGPHLLALLAGIWFRPRRTLRAVAQGPGWLWAVPFLVALALAGGLAFAAAPARDAQQRAQSAAMAAARQQELPPELRASPEEAANVPEPSRVLTLWLPFVIAAAGILFGWLLRAAVLHVSSMALGGQQGYSAVYRASAWATFPLLLRSAVQLVYVLVTGELVAGSGLSGLWGTPLAAPEQTASPVLSIPAILLGRVDLYTVWYVILLGVAVAAAGRLSRGKAAAVVIIYILLSLLVGLGQLLTQGFMGGLS